MNKISFKGSDSTFYGVTEAASVSSVHSLNHCQMPLHYVGTTIQGIMWPGNARRREDCESANQPLLEVILLELQIINTEVSIYLPVTLPHLWLWNCSFLVEQ